MANSMDTILVKYSGSQNVIPIHDFIYPEKLLNLTETERKIQEATRLVYELNNKEPPLYHKFPTFRSDKYPLTIDTTDIPFDNDCDAVYNSDNNTIKFHVINNIFSLAGIIAHELKHAELENEEIHKLRKTLRLNNAYGLHQLSFLTEAYAYVVGGYVMNRIKSGASNNEENTKIINEDIIKDLLPLLYEGNFNYKEEYDKTFPIGENDAGLDYIPKIFDLSPQLLKIIKKTPKKAKTLDGKLRQAEKNNHWKEYLQLLKKQIILKKLSPVRSIEKDPQYLSAITETLYRIINNKKDLKSFIRSIQDKDGCLPFSRKDFLDRSKMLLVSFSSPYNDESRAYLIKILPEFLKLKGKDKKPLIGEKQLSKVIEDWVIYCADNPKGLQLLLNTIKDKNENLPLSRKIFDIRDKIYTPWGKLIFFGENRLLNVLHDKPGKDLKYSLAILPILMALRDKDGKPIINQENIDKFPENTHLSKAVKAYKRTGIQKGLETQAKAGAKKLEQNPEGYVKKGEKSAQSSVKNPTKKINRAKGDFSL